MNVRQAGRRTRCRRDQGPAPGEDPGRSRDPFHGGVPRLPWCFFNRGKRSVTLDIDTTDGQHVLPRLASGADAVAQSSTPRFVWHLGDRYVEDFSAVGCDGLWATRSALRLGVPVAAASDAPVTAVRPLEIVQSAVMRTTRSGGSSGEPSGLTDRRP